MSGGINFNAPIGKANINTGDGMQVTGDGANVNTGSGTINVGGQVFGDGQVPTVPQVFDAIKKAVSTIELPTAAPPSGSDDDTVDYVQTDDDTIASDTIDSIDDSAEDVDQQILRPLQTLAELPPEEQKQPDRMEQAASLINRLVPYAPQIGKGLAVFGTAALASLAGSNPIISGILAVCKLASAENPSNTSSPG